VTCVLPGNSTTWYLVHFCQFLLRIFTLYIPSAGAPSNAGAKHLDVKSLSQCALATLSLPPHSRKQQTGIPVNESEQEMPSRFSSYSQALAEDLPKRNCFCGFPFAYHLPLSFCFVLSSLGISKKEKLPWEWDQEGEQSPRCNPTVCIPCITGHNPVLSSALIRVPQA
jgi:hypothetical protein